VEPTTRTLPVALAELALYVAATLLATFWLERRLLRETIGYLRRPTAASQAGIAA
jgi:hypothetical protein